MGRILVAYSTVDGHTRSICARARDVLQAEGHAVDLLDIDAGDGDGRGEGAGAGPVAGVDPAAFDAVLIGASIRYGHHRRSVHAFVATHHAALDRLPCAFFSVNLVARKPGRDTPASNPYVRKFLQQTGWAPREQAVFAGKLDYARYGVVDRLVIRLIMRLTGGPTDPSTCVDFTDWTAVEAFARRVAKLHAPSAARAGQ